MEDSTAQESIQSPTVPQIQSQSMMNDSNIDVVVSSTTTKKYEEVKSSMTLPTVGYRADIDGLRTISIVLVVLHHAWSPIFHGGYMGIYVFFVVSGYLISKHIFKELRKKKQFSYAKFYSRRIRRIFPALITMLIYTFIMLIQCYSPEQLKEASKSFMAACLMVINIHMIYKEYYRDQSWSTVQVLWTLGVEEQFYLFWPFFATKLWKLSMEKGLIALGIVTYILYQLFLDPNQNRFGLDFVMVPFWSPMAGCCLAYYEQKKLQRQQNSQIGIQKANVPVREETLWERAKSIKGIISSIAAIFIILSLTLQDYGARAMHWFWISALSTAVFIYCGKGIFNDLILGNRVTIFIGKISYSWYLLHFQLIKYCHFFTDNLYVQLLTGFILSVLCTYGIQNNIRFSKSKYVIPGLLLSMGFLLIVFYTVYLFPEAWSFQKPSS